MLGLSEEQYRVIDTHCDIEFLGILDSLSLRENCGDFLAHLPKCENVVVLWAGKSATFINSQSVTKGIFVSWNKRKTGEGLAFLFPTPGEGRYRNLAENGAMRLNAAFSLSSFIPELYLVKIVHRTNTDRDPSQNATKTAVMQPPQ